MKFTFRVERWQDVVDEMRPLWPLHWAEVAVNQDVIKPDCDEERYAKLQDLDMLHVITVRANGRLVGYAIWFLTHHFHYKSVLHALADMYFVLPEFRVAGVGARLFVESEQTLKARGVIRAHTSCKVEHDHQPLLEALGWTFTDKTFGKLLCQ
jgi:GNAT superfamily N-acetyltransferase